MDTINKLLWVLVITMVGLCIGFAIFLYKHEKERKKELLKAISDFDNTGQPNQSVHDATSASPT
jgi:preprotein translocase subunit SecG